MPRRCTVCDHPERNGIDEALVSGAPYWSVAKRFELSESAVYRHKTEHLPAHLLKAREVEEVARADDLLNQVRSLQTHALDILVLKERMPSVALRKRRDALEAVVGKRVEECNEERVEEEITNFLTLLEQHLSREEFLKVARIAAWGPSAVAEEGEG